MDEAGKSCNNQDEKLRRKVVISVSITFFQKVTDEVANP